MKRSAMILSAALMTVAIAGTGALFAQQGGGRGWGMGPGMMMGCGMFGYDDDGKAETFVDGRLAFLKAELKITDAQKGAWDAYSEALKMNFQTMGSMHQLMQTSFDAVV